MPVATKELCSLRPLVVLLCGLALILALGIAGNELVCSQTLYGAAQAGAVLAQPAAAAAPAGAEAGSTAPSRHTVAAFTSRLSREEVAAWTRLPRYTGSGFLLTALPAELRAELRQFHGQARLSPETGNGHLHGSVQLASLRGTALERRLESCLRGALERWTGQRDLVFTNSYGPRTYERGSWLAAHGDRAATHALSAIVYVGERALARPWGLQFVPVGATPASKAVDVFLSGRQDVLLYESTQPHGRVDALDGASYSVLFLHWRPADWQARATRLLG